jgi:GAF domain-containing protein
VVVGLVGAAAASVPAWRTTLISPMTAIREQPPSVWRWAHPRMQRVVRDIREAVGGDDSGSNVSPADVLTAFVEAARSAVSYSGALRAMLASVCEELHVESAALLERRDGSTPEYRCLVAAGALETAAPVVAADGFLIARLRAYPLPMPFSAHELDALADWAAAHRPERFDEIRALAAAGIRLAVPLRTRSEILGVLLLGDRPQRADFSAHEKQVLRACADQFALMIENARLTDRVVEQETLRATSPWPRTSSAACCPMRLRRSIASISPRPACRLAASAATATISSSWVTAGAASPWPTCREKASPPP